VSHDVEPHLDAGRRLRARVPLPVLGLLAGLAWGVVARAWMRYISEVPEFSWTGTAVIVGMSGLSGLSLGALEALRRRGRGRWRVLLALPAALLFVSPGALMFPAALFGGLAVSGRGGLPVRVGATLAALVPAVIVARTEPLPRSDLLSLLWFLALCAILATGWSVAFRRRSGQP
jgi:hypothetical protein